MTKFLGQLFWPISQLVISFRGAICKAQIFKHERQTYINTSNEFVMKSVPSHRPFYSLNGERFETIASVHQS
jgi:hypothetical protein